MDEPYSDSQIVEIVGALSVCSGDFFADGQRRCWGKCPFQDIPGTVECKAKLMQAAARVIKQNTSMMYPPSGREIVAD